MKFFYIGVLIILFGGLFASQASEKLKAKILAVFSGIGSGLVLLPALKTIFTGESISQNIYFSGLFGKVSVLIDPLSAFFILIISVMGFIGTLYAIGYIKPYLNKNNCTASHFFFLSLLQASMLMVVTLQNAVFFLIAWEIMSLSSFFLVIFESEKKETISAGINYLITMHVSVLFIITGFILLAHNAGSLDFALFKPTSLIFVLLFVGFGIKAGFVPFHSWLPKAHPAAPSHVSGIMSGVMIKTGIYGILRILSLMSKPSIEISYFVLIISVITALFGILYAVAQQNLKKLLAYSSIENIGVIGIGIAVGMLGLAYHNNFIAILGFSGGILHILNHAIFKELLFFGAGVVYNQTHIKNIEKLGGIIKTMPSTAALFLVGAVAISGLPPLNGFISEFLIYLGMLHNFEIKNPFVLIVTTLTIASLALVGTMALLCFTKVFSVVFLGMPRSKEAEEAKEKNSKTMLVPMGILACFVFLIGLFPQYALNLVKNPVNTVIMHSYCQEKTGNAAVLSKINNQKQSDSSFYFVQLVTTKIAKQLIIISAAGFSFIILFLIIYGLRTILLKNKVRSYKTWGCGYQFGNNRIQYTASSYASPYLSFLKPFLVKKFDILKPKELFPKEAYFELHIKDIFEFYLINPILKANKRFLEKFYWIQSGSTQQYILYGLIFLIIALVGSIGVK